MMTSVALASLGENDLLIAAGKRAGDLLSLDLIELVDVTGEGQSSRLAE